jgi:glucose-1-phosphate thymidylyltransferase
MKALILAAGYATRLYPLTKEYPKPLLEVGKRPIIDYIVDKLEKIKDLDEIIVVTNSKFIAKFRNWSQCSHRSKRISLVDDLTKDQEHKLGAIGDMNFVVAKKRIKDDLLVIGGDNLFDGDLNDFLSFAKTKKPDSVIGVYDIKDVAQADRYGVIKLNKEKRIVYFKEKPKNPSSTLVAMCLYYFSKGKAGLIKKYLATRIGKHDATGFYIDWLRKNEPVYGFVFDGRWFDIGQHSFYNKAKEAFF